MLLSQPDSGTKKEEIVVLFAAQIQLVAKVGRYILAAFPFQPSREVVIA